MRTGTLDALRGNRFPVRDPQSTQPQQPRRETSLSIPPSPRTTTYFLWIQLETFGAVNTRTKVSNCSQTAPRTSNCGQEAAVLGLGGGQQYHKSVPRAIFVFGPRGTFERRGINPIPSYGPCRREVQTVPAQLIAKTPEGNDQLGLGAAVHVVASPHHGRRSLYRCVRRPNRAPNPTRTIAVRTSWLLTTRRHPPPALPETKKQGPWHWMPTEGGRTKLAQHKGT